MAEMWCDPISEKQLVAAILLNERNANIAFRDVGVHPEDWSDETLRRMSWSIYALWLRKKPIDPVLVADELQERGDLEKVGGLAALVGLQADCWFTTWAEDHARRIYELARMRRLEEKEKVQR